MVCIEKQIQKKTHGWRSGLRRYAGLPAILLLLALGNVAVGAPDAPDQDMATADTLVTNAEYRLSITGIFALIKDDHILVTRVKPGSPVDGQVKPGDQVLRLQGRSLAGNLQRTLQRHMLRLWRENDGRLALTVLRPPETAGGEPERFVVRLHLPPPPGTLQHVGPTGIYAGIYEDHLLVDRIAEGSPADGILQPGDRVLAMAGKPLPGDLYARVTQAIEQAEKPAQEGRLGLTVLRPGTNDTAAETLAIELRLPVLPPRSPTTPVNCPKTDALITRAADTIVESGDTGRLDIGLLGLLATGEKRYIDYVGQRLQEADFVNPDLALSLAAPMTSWPWSYRLIILCEYYLLTGDAAMLPVIENYAVTIAKGQDAAGLWNHRMADPAANFGQLHGRLYGYGAINQTSVVLWIGLILAEKCGIEHPEVRAAVKKTQSLYGNWIGKGALPYGNHGPMERLLTNNGTSGSAAVAFALLGDTAGAGFYARLSAAAHGAITTGHTGPFFNYLWSGLGVNVLGPATLSAYARKLRWLRTMTRRWDGGFLYMEARGGVFAYSGLSATGATLLNLSAGRRALHITGKAMDPALWLAEPAARQAIERPEPDAEMAAADLLALLGHPLPPVRLEAAGALAEGAYDVSAEVVAMLETGTRDQRIGALHAIGTLGLSSATDALMGILRDPAEDPWIRELAVTQLGELDAAKAYANELLARIVADQPKDPFGNLDRAAGFAVEKLLAPDPDQQDLDREVLYAAALKLLDHKHMWGRMQGVKLLQDVPLADFYRVADKLMYVIQDKDRSYTAYHGDGHRQEGLEILDRLGIEDVIPLTIHTIKEPTGRAGARRRRRLRLLKTFDANAQPYIADIKAVLGDKADPIVSQIEASTEKRPMISLEEAKKTGSGNP